MAKKFADLRAKLSEPAQARARERAEAILREMPLQDLRRARHFTQESIAKVLDMSQPEVSKLEKRTDCYISTVRSYIRAMGGELEIVARFPEGDVRITQFEDVGDLQAAEQ